MTYHKYRFNREPKVRTIEQVHDIYLKASERSRIKQNIAIGIIDRIVAEVPEFEKDKRKVYFIKDDLTYQIELRKTHEYGWGICSPDLVKFDNHSSKKSRNEKLEFLITNQKAFELGELYHSLRGNNKYYHHFVWRILSDKIQDRLRDVFEGKEAPRILTVLIGGKKYYVECEEQYRHFRTYKKFNLLNEVGEEFVMK